MSAGEPVKQTEPITTTSEQTDQGTGEQIDATTGASGEPNQQTGDQMPVAPVAAATGEQADQGTGEQTDAATSEQTTPSQQTDDQMTGSEEEEIAFLEGYAPADGQEEDWQHFTTDSDEASDYSTLTEGSASSDNLLSLENQSKLDEIAKKTQEKLEKRQKQKKKKQKKRKLSEEGKEETDEQPSKKKKTKTWKKGKNKPGSWHHLKLDNKGWRRLKRKQRKRNAVLYIGHVPNGFFEKQMKRFFRQFGDIDRVRIVRNRMGKSKGYAFVEFRDREVAEIVAEAMNGYLLFDRKLVANVVPKEKTHPMMMKGYGPEGVNSEYYQMKRAAAVKARKKLTVAESNRREKGRARNRQRKLRKMGIDYKIPEFIVKS